MSLHQLHKNDILPKEYKSGHQLSFVIHDILLQLLKSGEEGGFFRTTIKFENNTQKESFNNSNDIFTWLESEERYQDRALLLKSTVLPAILSDMLQCIYEALESSRKGRLVIFYMLIRKPIQESLYLFESIVLNDIVFAGTIANNPLKLRPKNAGGIEGHTKRIQDVLEVIDFGILFDANYLATLRYDKTSFDSFDGICNHAMHLFTEHKAIKTDKLNINFIFSSWSSKETQWSYLYTRLPYLLLYIYYVIDHIVLSIAPTTEKFINDMQRRIYSLIFLWSFDIDDDYRSDKIDFLIKTCKKWIDYHCEHSGFKHPTKKDLVRMAKTGAYPNESANTVKKRNKEYEIQAAKNNEIEKNCVLSSR